MNIIIKLMCLLSFLGEACVQVRAQQHLVTGNNCLWIWWTSGGIILLVILKGYIVFRKKVM